MEALAALFDYYRPRLHRMLRLWMDGRVAARLEASDVLQETFLDAARQVAGYLRKPKVPGYLWLRGLTRERLLKLQRRHLEAKCRAVNRERPLPADCWVLVADRLVGQEMSPSQMMLRKELRQKVQQALAKLAPNDQEIIRLRDFEGMSNGEAAQRLGVSDAGATMRYGRALTRLKEVLMADHNSGERQP
jgi:RNA polymerase sigma-70 factor (ECF subfamily)